MREILSELDRWLEQGEEIALATLVSAVGPSPRPSGARLALTRSGRMAGSVSGGCVEADVFERGLQVLDENRPAIVRYGISDEMGAAVGLSCGGEIDVLIEPFRADEAWLAVREALATERPAALCLALEPDALAGRRLAVLGRGRVAGIDPELDEGVEKKARRLLDRGGSELFALPWRADRSRIFIEAFAPTRRLFVVGATHTAIALCRLARVVGFHVCVIDPRTPFANRERFADADELVCEWPDEVLERCELDASAYVLSLSHDLKFDIPTLARALRSKARYIGALGSRRTHERRKARLREQGFDDADLARIHTPVGLDIGARTPEEIALAILAEMVAANSGRDGRSLLQRSEPIHDDD